MHFDSELFESSEVNYSDITTIVKNNIIHEESQAAFRRLSYIDELMDHFATHPAILTKLFKAQNPEKKYVEVTIIYGARDHSLTFFIRELSTTTYDE